MRLLVNLGFFSFGVLVALLAVSLARVSAGPLGIVQYPLIVLALAVFFWNAERLAALVVGLGVGLDVMSSYPFLSWLIILAGTAAVGYYLSQIFLTNRSLPSFLLLGAVMRVVYFLFELSVSRLSVFVGGTVWYSFSGRNLLDVFSAFGLELLFLVAIFIGYVRWRGDRSRMLSHI